MKRLITISLVGVMCAGAGLAHSSNTWAEHWSKAKYNRYSPMLEARQNALQSELALREETAGRTSPRVVSAPPATSWVGQWLKAKLGR